MIIDCIKCGNKISDKSFNCTKCACPTSSSLEALEASREASREALSKKCEECGNSVSAGEKICSECGAPYSAQVSTKSRIYIDYEEYDSLRNTAHSKRALIYKRDREKYGLREGDVDGDTWEAYVCPYCKEDFALPFPNILHTNYPCPHCSKALNILEEDMELMKRKEVAEKRKKHDLIFSWLIFLSISLGTLFVIIVTTTNFFKYPIGIGDFVVSTIAAAIVGIIAKKIKDVPYPQSDDASFIMGMLLPLWIGCIVFTMNFSIPVDNTIAIVPHVAIAVGARLSLGISKFRSS